MDSDLAESLSALKDVFARRGIAPTFGKAEPDAVRRLKDKLRIPRRFRDFLLESDPVDVETVTPVERVRLIGSSALEGEQRGHALDEAGELVAPAGAGGWRPTWIIIGHSALLGDPYFLDVSKPDAEGDCPVFTAMSGTDTWQPRLCASSFAMFLRILAIGMDVAQGFSNDSEFDVDDEGVFREALAPRIREYDPAAVKAGHWT